MTSWSVQADHPWLVVLNSTKFVDSRHSPTRRPGAMVPRPDQTAAAPIKSGDAPASQFQVDS